MADVIIIGAGVSGLYALHRLRERGISAHVYEANDDVGGTWFKNRYPGARFDSESYTYAYSFSPELLEEWDWSEHFAAQPETLRYLQHVADRFDLRRDITFGRRVTSAIYDDRRAEWTVTLDDGLTDTARFVIGAIGVLTAAPNPPPWPGVADFAGTAFHTTDWPEGLDLTGKRVAVIGTGATAVQLIPEVAKVASHLTVYQRTPNWCAPLGNAPITAEEQADLKARYGELFERCRTTFGAFVHDADRRKALEVSATERAELFERLWAERGFAIWMGNFRDTLVNAEANKLISDFVADKIRARVHDPALAEKLIPTDHGFGTRRVPMETNYYEAYNRPNVDLVDLRATPIERITRDGIVTSDGERAFDVIVYAVGFDAITGPYDRMDIRGRDRRTLRDAWADGPRTLFGLMTAGFPNFFMVIGPQQAGGFCNMTRCIETNSDWIVDLIDHVRAQHKQSVEPTVEAQEEWNDEVIASAERMLFTKVPSWFTGARRAGFDGTLRNSLVYVGGVPAFNERCAQAASNGYAGFVIV
ncbi:MAG TPA: NAD(P)/FAD-dependent oxidoreductase [Acidimicrobiales bacterium]|nr:NAD(P)/FAD-dependent oxidoreductase [Acidimicrobiales bacterium]